MKAKNDVWHSDDTTAILAQAIILQAAKDYILLNRTLRSGKTVDRYGYDKASEMRKNLETLRAWFKGKWCNTLNPLLDGERLLRRLDWNIEKKLGKFPKTVDDCEIWVYNKGED